MEQGDKCQIHNCSVCTCSYVSGVGLTWTDCYDEECGVTITPPPTTPKPRMYQQNKHVGNKREETALFYCIQASIFLADDIRLMCISDIISIHRQIYTLLGEAPV